ncbi:Clavesin-2 [Saguinus oedipus]|uniref:Clavesin-2 n=1 Tax=Saguinus oedipus TaxID=9490 RepID=A0ABQ9VY43_SAGOE|nr:Clavesin-2 [Saguinus oedipus]
MTHLQAGLSPETLEKARLELNENPDTLHQDIQEVRDMVITRPDIGFLRTDDAFILRFLRARKFHHFEAFRLLAQYFEYRQQNLDMFKSFKATDPGIKQALKDGFPGGLANLDHYGRKILVLFAANWDQSRKTDYYLKIHKAKKLIQLAIEREWSFVTYFEHASRYIDVTITVSGVINMKERILRTFYYEVLQTLENVA